MPTWNIPNEIKALFTVLEIREQNGYDFPANLGNFMANVRKSALFQRILSGKEPLPIPPPKSYAYPWYELIDNGFSFPYEVWEAKHYLWTEFPSIGIDQSLWKLEKELGQHDYIVSYFYGREQKQVSETKWHVFTIGSRLPRNNDPKSKDFLWKIELVK